MHTKLFAFCVVITVNMTACQTLTANKNPIPFVAPTTQNSPTPTSKTPETTTPPSNKKVFLLEDWF